ncbi:DUF6752 domain-containing protein [Nocardioides sp. SYSU D00038]|uniref:DUF6752 domain-containing protein n=1 Tax=Nocardioides sp. SYSU D00038 TaxID=2812554 RepID=UPI0019682952|nr:DUF6752 domain-containing protein [Nocardioides sp. SYSU D00038]
MTKVVHLHIGSPKSGTTYVQRILERNRERLAAAGVLVVGERHLDRIHAALGVREDPRWAALGPRQQQAWPALVEEIRAWSGGRAILSYELFSAAGKEQAEKALADLAGLDVHVVVTARDLAAAVPSAWQERLKFGLTKALGPWRPPAEHRERSEWGWRTLDPAGVTARWGATLPPDHVHVVTVPRSRDDRAELWRRFARACGIEDVAVDLDLPRVNESLGVVEAELLRRVNALLRPPLEGDRELALWLRDTLAHGVLAGISREPIGLPPELHREATTRADAAVATLTEAGYDVQGDLDDLRAGPGGGRLLDDVGDDELLASALEAIVRLLLLVREAGTERTRQADRPGGVRGLAGAVTRRTTGAWVRRRDDRLRERIAALEAEVMQARALHLRVAALQDVVTELLLPARQRDQSVTVSALSTYRKESL